MSNLPFYKSNCNVYLFLYVKNVSGLPCAGMKLPRMGEVIRMVNSPHPCLALAIRRNEQDPGEDPHHRAENDSDGILHLGEMQAEARLFLNPGGEEAALCDDGCMPIPGTSLGRGVKMPSNTACPWHPAPPLSGCNSLTRSHPT